MNCFNNIDTDNGYVGIYINITTIFIKSRYENKITN